MERGRLPDALLRADQSAGDLVRLGLCLAGCFTDGGGAVLALECGNEPADMVSLADGHRLDRIDGAVASPRSRSNRQWSGSSAVRRYTGCHGVGRGALHAAVSPPGAVAVSTITTDMVTVQHGDPLDIRHLVLAVIPGTTLVLAAMACFVSPRQARNPD
ncbi:hypothetical protein AU15_16840 [Marinobacter salarius]|uniref:Uncharacterized protein n=1 Tax=Marinobacter salarius TaxID=1420917 RepID=W5YVN1_9GAMM|nr:hypothetical protein AU15_16840 [Marinobacter salarius]